jgi:hypothetical protein
MRGEKWTGPSRIWWYVSRDGLTRMSRRPRPPLHGRQMMPGPARSLLSAITVSLARDGDCRNVAKQRWKNRTGPTYSVWPA